MILLEIALPDVGFTVLSLFERIVSVLSFVVLFEDLGTNDE